jgi:lysozyme family protein
MEKAAADLVRAITALVEKAARALEKVVAGRRQDGDAGWRTLDAVENAEAARHSAVTVELGCGRAFWRMEATGYD